MLSMSKLLSKRAYKDSLIKKAAPRMFSDFSSDRTLADIQGNKPKPAAPVTTTADQMDWSARKRQAMMPQQPQTAAPRQQAQPANPPMFPSHTIQNNVAKLVAQEAQRNAKQTSSASSQPAVPNQQFQRSRSSSPRQHLMPVMQQEPAEKPVSTRSNANDAPQLTISSLLQSPDGSSGNRFSIDYSSDTIMDQVRQQSQQQPQATAQRQQPQATAQRQQPQTQQSQQQPQTQQSQQQSQAVNPMQQVLDYQWYPGKSTGFVDSNGVPYGNPYSYIPLLLWLAYNQAQQSQRRTQTTAREPQEEYLYKDTRPWWEWTKDPNPEVQPQAQQSQRRTQTTAREPQEEYLLRG